MACGVTPLGALLGDPERTVIFHAAENDVIALNHEFGWRIGHLFDTQIASFVLGTPPYSLAGVLETLQGIQSSFNEAQSGDKEVSLADLIVLAGAAAVEASWLTKIKYGTWC